MLDYKKSDIKKDRRITTSGPRDVQIRNSRINEPGVLELKEYIKELRDELSELKNRPELPMVDSGLPVSNTKIYSSEEFDSELVKHITKAVEETKAYYTDKLSKLESESKELYELRNRLLELELTIKHKDELIKTKDDMIESLKNLKTSIVVNNQSDNDMLFSDRPTLETVYVDPTSKYDEDKLVANISIKEELEARDKVNEKLSKLKNIMGGLPKR